MRLINADDVKELLNGLESLPWEEQVDELVDAIPTAYDLDKVVAGLENLQDTDTREVYFTKHICLDDAINIVREGV